jgi:hypothetical protein
MIKITLGFPIRRLFIPTAQQLAEEDDMAQTDMEELSGQTCTEVLITLITLTTLLNPNHPNNNKLADHKPGGNLDVTQTNNLSLTRTPTGGKSG